MKFFYHTKTPKGLNDYLCGFSYWKSHYKLIPTITRTLNQILLWNYKNEGESEITRTYFLDKLGYSYPDILRHLELVGLLKITRFCYKSTPTQRGRCYGYQLTNLCHNLLSDTNWEYLYLLMNDKKEKRRNQIRISKRGYHKKVYRDVRDEIKRTIDGISFDLNKLSKVVNTYPVEEKARIGCLLVDIIEKDYKDLTFNSSDGRVWNVLTQLPSEIRSIIEINNLIALMIVDMRSCHPTFWGRYISSIETSPEIEKEVEKYDLIFRGRMDPKDYFSQLFGVPRSEMKMVLNQYINGKGFKGNVFSRKGKNDTFRKYDTWLRSEFPTLYSVWMKTKLKETGNNIAKNYECRLTLDLELYKKARELGLEIGYEYDGMTLYGKDKEKCYELLEYLKQRSIELLGIEMVFVCKSITSVGEWTDELRIERLSKKLSDLESKRKGLSRRCWRNKNWTPYYHLQNEKEKIIQELQPLLDEYDK